MSRHGPRKRHREFVPISRLIAEKPEADLRGYSVKPPTSVGQINGTTLGQERQELILMRGVESEGSTGPNGGPPPTATLVIRVWRDTESPEPFRARIIAGSSESDEQLMSYARGREDVLAAVNRWLHKLPDA